MKPTAASAAAVGVVVIPGFFIGAFAPAIKEDLGFGDAGLGALFTVGFFVSAVVLQVGGVFADLGARRAIRVGLAIAALGAGFVALGARTYALLVIGFAIARVAEAIVQPATNTLISGAVPANRRGLAMGIKQSAVPVATSLAGLAVPILGEVLGWRGVFGLLAIMAIPAAYAVPEAHSPVSKRPQSRGTMWGLSHLRLAAVAGGFAAGSVITVGAFLVTAAVEDAGFSQARAGLLLTLGGVIMTIARVVLGALADRGSFNRFRVVAAVLFIGVSAFPLFAVGAQWSMVAGTAILFGIGWSFPGLFLLGIVELHPKAPGAATAVMQTGVRLGAMASPLIFGIVAESTSFAVAWMVPMTSMVIGAVLMFVLGTRANHLVEQA